MDSTHEKLRIADGYPERHHGNEQEGEQQTAKVQLIVAVIKPQQGRKGGNTLQQQFTEFGRAVEPAEKQEFVNAFKTIDKREHVQQAERHYLDQRSFPEDIDASEKEEAQEQDRRYIYPVQFLHIQSACKHRVERIDDPGDGDHQQTEHFVRISGSHVSSSLVIVSQVLICQLGDFISLWSTCIMIILLTEALVQMSENHAASSKLWAQNFAWPLLRRV